MDIKPVDISILTPRLSQIPDAGTPLEVDKIIQLTKLDAPECKLKSCFFVHKGIS